MTALERGFVLVATLWILAGLTVLASYISGVATEQVERATLAKAALDRELDRRNTETTLVYLLATNRKNFRGLVLDFEQRFRDPLLEVDPEDVGDGEISFGGEAYLGIGEVRFSIQDEMGLAPVNSPSFPVLPAVLEHVGVSQRNVELIAARIGDYVDLDDGVSLNGAERFDYVDRGLPPPANWPMASPLEMRKVLGVDELLTPEQWFRLRPLLTMRQPLGHNFNTMHPRVMAALLDMGPEAVSELVAARQTGPVNRTALTGRYIDIDGSELRILPSDHLRVSTWHGDSARTLIGIQLTPYMDGSPWRQDYRYTEPAIDELAWPDTAPERPQTALLQ